MLSTTASTVAFAIAFSSSMAHSKSTVEVQQIIVRLIAGSTESMIRSSGRRRGRVPVIPANVEQKVGFLAENVSKLVDSLGKLSDAVGQLVGLRRLRRRLGGRLTTCVERVFGSCVLFQRLFFHRAAGPCFGLCWVFKACFRRFQPSCHFGLGGPRAFARSSGSW